MDCTRFVDAISSVSLPSVFNPYSDQCEFSDITGVGAGLRRNTLESYLDAVMKSSCDTMWMGRDLGYRGGRRTGLALTDEANLGLVPIRYPGTTVAKATTGPIVAERTAAEIWRLLMSITFPPLLWNVFPFHPHEPGNPMTNRKFTSRELKAAEEINQELISWLRIRRIVAIGQDAASYARRLGVEVLAVRHPSYGGVKEFRKAMSSIYSLNREQTVKQLDLMTQS